MPNQTGPTSVTGRLASCMNNFQHGGTSTTLFLPDEEPKAFFSLLENAFEQHQPAFDQDAALVTDSVRARWILTRRQRAAERYEAALYERKPDSQSWVPTADLAEMTAFDRYITQAERGLYRALKSLQLVQKMTNDKQRWQQQFESEKQRLAIHVERWELAKANGAAQKKQAPDDDLPSDNSSPEQEPDFTAQPNNEQTVYIGYEGRVEHHYETTPTNEELAPSLSKSGRVTRTYNFVGGIPPRFDQLVVEANPQDFWRRGASASLRKVYTYNEWIELIANE